LEDSALSPVAEGLIDDGFISVAKSDSDNDSGFTATKWRFDVSPRGLLEAADRERLNLAYSVEELGIFLALS